MKRTKVTLLGLLLALSCLCSDNDGPAPNEAPANGRARS